MGDTPDGTLTLQVCWTPKAHTAISAVNGHQSTVQSQAHNINFTKSGRGYPQISMHTCTCNSVCNNIAQDWQSF